MTISSKRAEHVAWAGLALSSVFFVATLLFGNWSGFFAISAVSWLSLSAVLIWFVLLVQFHQRSLAEQEKLDMAQLSSASDGSTIFQQQGENAAVFAIAQRRLELLEKWFVPIFSAIIAIYEIFIGLYLLKTLYYSGSTSYTKEPLFCVVILAVISFMSFLISRFATGMSTEVKWKPLRAGGSILLVLSLVCLAIAVALAFANFNYPFGMDIMSWVVAGLLVLLGVECGLNTVFDIYRPRLKGQYNRTAFDSRLLSVINEPGGIFRSVASSIDYQFGFKVSHTWFYKLMEKAILPLVLFAAAALYLMSCIVVINPNEQGIVEHFGNPRTASGQVRAIGPGLHFKWPWLIDKVQTYPASKIRQLTIGYKPKDLELGQQAPPLIWGKQHYEWEDDFMVASAQDSGTDVGAVPVNLVDAAVPVHYRVKDLYAFLYNYGVVKKREGNEFLKIYQAEELLRSICYGELTRFTASASIETDGVDVGQSLLGAGRRGAAKILTQRIQQAADDAGLGVEVVFVGLQGIHPPLDVASDYQNVVGAVQKQQTAILAAEGESIAMLGSLVGSVEEAGRLSRLATEYRRAEQANDSGKVAELGNQLDQAFANAKGDIFKTLRQSQSYAFERSTLAKATGERFAGQLKAYEAAKDYYKRERRLLALESLKDIRKFVIVADEDDKQVFIVDVKEKLTPSLYDIGGIEENKNK